MSALSKALNYLTIKARTEREIRDYLLRKNYDEPQVNQCISKLIGLDYINDQRTAADYVAFVQRHKPSGRKKIRSVLMLRGVDRTIIDAVLDSIDDELEYDMAQKLVNKRSFKSRNHLWRYLQGRGFGFQTIERACRESSPGND